MVELIELSIANIQKSLNGKFYKVLSKEIRENLVNSLKDENGKINIFTKEKMVTYFSCNYKSTLKEDDLIKFIDDLLVTCFSFYFSEFKNDKIPDKIIKMLNESIINNFVKPVIKAYTDLSSEIINAILFDKSLLLLELQVKDQKDKKTNIKTENLKSMTDFKSTIKNLLDENLFYVAQKILVGIIFEKVLFPLCDILMNIMMWLIH